MHETDINESLSKQWKREVRLGRGLDQSITIAPIIEPISNVPAVIAKRSQPGSVADDIAADELVVLAAVGVVPFEVVEAPVLVGAAVLPMMLDPVTIALLPIVETVVQEEEDGMGWGGGVLGSP